LVPNDSPESLQQYDTGADKYVVRRYRQFLFYVIVPVVLFCGGGWLLLTRPLQQQSPSATKLVATVTPRTVSGDNVIGGRIVVTETKVAQVVPTQVPVSRLRCYARVDARGVYSDVILPAESLVYADAFTRANQGMIWNKNLGWFSLRDLVCAPGLENFEVEFIPPPRSPTPKPVVILPTRTRTPLPSPTVPLPTSTPLPGVLVWDIFYCHEVRWQVWGASRVYLTIGNNRSGVPGEEYGGPVVRDLCEHVGKRIRLDVFLRDGQQIYREGMLQ
jgi:hypothetical protein